MSVSKKGFIVTVGDNWAEAGRQFIEATTWTVLDDWVQFSRGEASPTHTFRSSVVWSIEPCEVSVVASAGHATIVDTLGQTVNA